MSIRRWIEISAWVAGGALLAACAAVQVWSASASNEGIAALHQARAGKLSHRSTRSFIAMEQELPATSAPDLSSWSKSRITAYRQAVATGDVPEAVLRIPSLDLEVPVYAGASEWNLNRGAGRIEGTPTAGSAGNVGIAGHRDGFFRPLKDIRVGDLLYMDTVQGQTTYRVTRMSIVSPDAIEVLNDTARASVTLVTCYPFYYLGAAPKRFIVRAEVVSSGRQRARRSESGR